MNNNDFKFGTCTVPNGKRGPWTVGRFSLSREDVLLANLRALRDNPTMICPPGDYVRLSHKDRGVVMSNTPMEIRTAHECYMRARSGKILINGLGLGMVLEGVLSRPEVTAVRVVEIDADLIALVGPHFQRDPRVEIVCADAYEYRPPKGERFDYVWHDIWDDICEDNLPLMAKLTRSYGQRAAAQGAWSRDMVRRQKRRDDRRGFGW